jgi:Holliday junction resolvase RusA-like endonuclease
VRHATISIVVFGIAQPKQRPRKGAFSWYTPNETRNYETLVRTVSGLAVSQFQAETGVTWQRDAEYAVNIVAFMPDGRLRDTDNIIKTCLDGMQPIIFTNDAKVKSVSGTVLLNQPNPRAEITVRRTEKFSELAERSRRLLLLDVL